MELILNAGLGAGILIFLVLFFKQRKTGGDYFFLSWIFIVLLQIVFYQVTIYSFDLHGIWAIVGFGLPLLSSPLLFLYILYLTGNRPDLKTIIAHLGTYIIYLGILLFVQRRLGYSLIASKGYFHLPIDSPSWAQYYAVPMAISGLVYCILDLILLYKHQKRISNFFSFDEKINLKWIQYIVYAYFALFSAGAFLVFGAIHFNLFKIENAFAFLGTALSIVLIAFGFYGFRQTQVFSSIEVFKKVQEPNYDKITNKSFSYAKSGLTDSKIEKHAKLLEELMLIEKPFLLENLTLLVLAEKCGLTQAQLSQIINQHFQMNFYDFVNKYRIDKAKKMLISSDYGHLSILGIAYDCGFKSKSSFNRYFKKYCGISPSEYKNKNS